MLAFVINLDNRPDRMTDFQKNIFPFEVKRVSGIKTNPGWIGCSNSHLFIMRKQKEFPFVIFEDDCVLLDSWNNVEKTMLQLPSNWDALWLGASQCFFAERYSENLFKARELYCHHAVIYNSQLMIDFYLENYYQSGLPIDAYSASVVSHRFNCFLINPMIARQRIGFSDIENKVVDYAPWFDNVQNILNNK
jgi:hypothetical protein